MAVRGMHISLLLLLSIFVCFCSSSQFYSHRYCYRMDQQMASQFYFTLRSIHIVVVTIWINTVASQFYFTLLCISFVTFL